MFGGALFMGSAVMISSMPRGCIRDECGTRSMRETGAAGVLLTLALLLVVVGMAGLVIRARHAGRFGVLGKTGAVVAAVGAALPIIGSLIQGILYGGDYPLMPYFVIPGVLALVVGFVLLGIALLLAGCGRAGRRCCSWWAPWRCSGSTTRTPRRCWPSRTVSRGWR
jgi:hypothetical protein